MTSASAPIAVATSIPPKLTRRNGSQIIGADYQQLCIRSLTDCGFRVMSVNDREEIAALRPNYPDVHFVETERNASAWTGRKNPYIADLLAALKDAPEPVVGIVNSDIVFEPSEVWRQSLTSVVSSSILVGQRYDASSLSNGVFRRYHAGFDWFLFDKPLAAALAGDAMPYAMGVPWWDYWLPSAAAFQNRKVFVVDYPRVAHLVHKQGYAESAWYQFGLIFAQFVTRESDRAQGAVPDVLASLAPLCRELAEVRDKVMPFGGAMHQKLHAVGNRLSTRICRNRLRLDPRNPQGCENSPPPDDRLTAAHVFRRFGARFGAGEALERGRRFLQEGKHAEAGAEFLAAMREAPDDGDVLTGYGEYVFQSGEKEKGCALLRKATAQNPDSPHALESLGVALSALGKSEEAFACYEKAVTAEPGYLNVYVRLVIGLCAMSRRDDALQWLRRLEERWPSFDQAIELRWQIENAFPRA